jgi:hypothetical protein
MSTLVTNNIQNLAGTASTSADNVINGSAKAWVNFNGTGTVAIRASYNVSSITDNGAGDYTVNFTNAFADANYSLVGAAAETLASDQFPARYFSIDTMTTSNSRILVSSGSDGVRRDAEAVNVAVFR